MSRSRKPVSMQSKHLTNQEKDNLEQAEASVTVGKEALKTPPGWLIDKTAKKEFKRIVKEFESIDVVGNLDLNNIGAYCNAFANYCIITEELKKTPITKRTDENNHGSPMVMNPLYSSLKSAQTEFAFEMRKFGACCGLTIDSRLKVGVVKVSKVNEAITNEFGDI